MNRVSRTMNNLFLRAFSRKFSVLSKWHFFEVLDILVLLLFFFLLLPAAVDYRRVSFVQWNG